MERAVVELPDWEHAIINGEKGDITEVESILITGACPIPENSFRELSKLRDVEIADEVTGIEDDVFVRCESLERIHFGKGIKYMGDSLLYGCKKIEELVIPGNVKSIGFDSFGSLSNLKHLVIEDGVENIGSRAFDNCSELVKIDLPKDSIQHIDGSILQKSKWMKKNKEEFITVCDILIEYKGKKDAEHVVMPDNIKGMTSDAFACASFKEIKIGKGITIIPEMAFRGNSNLESVLIPEGVREIGNDVFKDCDHLKKVKVPDSLMKVGASSLSPEYLDHCPKKGCVYAGKAVIGCLGDPRHVAINEGTYSISPGAFDLAYNLETLALPNSIQEINCVFLACKRLSAVIVPQGFPSSCLKAFEYMKDLTIITWPGSDAEKFAQEKEMKLELAEEGMNPADLLKKASKKRRPKVSEVITPGSWFRRTGNALAGFSSVGLKEIRSQHIKTIALPAEIEGVRIERLVFDCLSILRDTPEVEELIIPGEIKIQGLTTIDGRDCWDFPNTETIKRLVFTGTTPINFYRYLEVFDDSLESISIHESDRFVSYEGVIYSKDGKKLVYYPRSKKDKKFTVPSCVKVIWSRSFSNVKHLEEIILPDGLEDIYNEAFKDSSIKNINIPGSVRYIAEEAFMKCELDCLVLNEGTNHISESAFRGCTAENVTIPITLKEHYILPKPGKAKGD